MNAYELADELWEKYLDNNECQHGYALSSGCPNDDCKEQALYDSADMLRQQADRIGVLEANHEIQKNINEKALQYIAELEKEKKHLTAYVDYFGDEIITPQTKPLSNEEIWSFADMVLENSDVIGFARAIEERHGIK